MKFVIRNYDTNNHYYVELIEGCYVGNKITNFYTGMNSFRTINDEIIKIPEQDLDIIINKNGYKTYLWHVIGKVVPMKDSELKLIV